MKAPRIYEDAPACWDQFDLGDMRLSVAFDLYRDCLWLRYETVLPSGEQVVCHDQLVPRLFFSGDDLLTDLMLREERARAVLMDYAASKSAPTTGSSAALQDDHMKHGGVA